MIYDNIVPKGEDPNDKRIGCGFFFSSLWLVAVPMDVAVSPEERDYR